MSKPNGCPAYNTQSLSHKCDRITPQKPTVFYSSQSDRFADSVFNALVDRYSKDTKNKEVEAESVKKSE
ncbi:hypothetical protein B4U84_30125 [Westiellopsis prolifica IICB1]|nr:hypothetical protein B4U84_30125 [Westiellopsis prolifica IICB1]